MDMDEASIIRNSRVGSDQLKTNWGRRGEDKVTLKSINFTLISRFFVANYD